MKGKNCKIFLVYNSLSCIWNKANLLANALLCSDFSQYALFFKSLINAGFLLLVGPDILMNVLEDCIIFLYLDGMDFVWFPSEFTLTKIWFMKKYKHQESWSNKNHPQASNSLNMFNSKYYIKYSNYKYYGKYTNSCNLFFFVHSFKLKTEGIID